MISAVVRMSRLLGLSQCSEVQEDLPARSARVWDYLAALIIVTSTALSLAYVWLCCPLDLAADEAHYWDWSRHLDWSYYSKGPLVAWLIRASCELVGSTSSALTGDLGPAVRLPAVICHAVTLAGSYLLASHVFRSPKLGLAVIAVEATIPLVRVGAVLMTIDPPFLACWCWSLVCVEKAISPHHSNKAERVWWLGAAFFAFMGTLAKYTMALFPLAIVGFALCHQRTQFHRVGIWLFLAASLLGWFPIVIWNAGHDWASFRHVFGQVGGHGAAIGEGFRWFGPLAFLGGQFGMLFGAWLLAFLMASWRFSPTREKAIGIRVLWWSSVPVWCLFAAASFVKSGQPNWPAPSYLAGIILAVAWVQEQFRGNFSRSVRTTVAATVLASLLATAAIHSPGTVRPLLATLVRDPSEAKPLPVRDLDISARLVGWKTLAREVDRLALRAQSPTGEKPVLAATHWTLPGHLRFYCQDHPDVYAIGLPNHSDRHSQYDYWRPNPLKDAQAFWGRTFIIVGELGPGVATAFDSTEPVLRVVHAEAGIPIAAWSITVCHGFHGFMPDSFDSTEYGY